MSRVTVDELLDLLTRRKTFTDIVPRENTVLFSIGERQFLANRDLEVLEVADDKVFASEHAAYQQGVLRGGKRDEGGNLILTNGEV